MANVILKVNTVVSGGAWTDVGTTPYLDAQDQPTNYTHSNSRNAISDVFGFEDSADLGTITSVTLYIYAQQGGASTDFSTFVNTTDTGLGPPATWGLVSVDVTSIVGTTWAGVNAATMYFDKPNTANDPAVDYAYLDVVYSGASPQINKYDSINVSESVTTHIPIYYINKYDSVNVAETVTVIENSYNINVFDSPTVAETIASRASPQSIDVYSSATTAETVTAIEYNLVISVYDSVNISELDPPTATIIYAPTSTLTDNFNDNSIDTAKWLKIIYNSATVEETTEKIVVTPAPSTVDSKGEMRSVEFYNLTGSSIFVNVPSVSTTTGVVTALIFGDENLDIKVEIYQVGGTLVASDNVNGVGATIDWNATTMAWWRIRESGGTTYWEYGANGIDWTELNHLSNPIDLNYRKIWLHVQEQSSQASPGVSHFDSFNIQGTANKDVNVYDEVFISESIEAKATSLYINVFDSIEVSEEITAGITGYFVDVFDTVNVSENVAAKTPSLLINVYNSISISEAVYPRNSYDIWSGLGVNATYYLIEQHITMLVADGFEVRITLPDYQDTDAVAAAKVGVLKAVAEGANVVWGVTSNSFNDASYALTAENWSDFTDAVKSAAAWSQANGVYEFQIGNEEEWHCYFRCPTGALVRSGNTVTATTPVAHGFDGTHQVTITGSINPIFLGTFDINVTDTTHFTYTTVTSGDAESTDTAYVTTLPQATLITNLKALATEVQAIFTNGNVSYSCAHSFIYDESANWVTAGKGDIDLLASNVYMGGTTFDETWKTEINSLLTAFGPTGTYLSEFAPSSTSLDSYSTNEATQAAGVAEMLGYIASSGMTRAFFFMWQNTEFGVITYANHWRQLWYSLIAEYLPIYNLIGVSEDVTVSSGGVAPLTINVYDSITVEDVLLWYPDTVYVRESVVVEISGEVAYLEVNKYDSIIVSEGITVTQAQYKIDVSDNINVSEEVTPSQSGGTEINVYDSISTSENKLCGPYVDYYSENNKSAANVLYSGNVTKISQSFTGTGTTLSSVKFYLGKTGSPTGNAYAKVYSHSGTYGSSSVPNALLATSDAFDVSTLTEGSFELETFTFSGVEQISLTNGTHYVVTLEYDGGDSSNKVNIGYDLTSSSHSGNYAVYTTSWTSWFDYDLCFYVYHTEDTSINLSSAPGIDVYDSATVAEDVTVEEAGGTQLISVYDGINVSESTTVTQGQYNVNVISGIVVSESTTVIEAQYKINVYDGISVSEDTSINREAYYKEISVSDSITVSQSVTTFRIGGWDTTAEGTSAWAEIADVSSSWTNVSDESTAWSDVGDNSSSWTDGSDSSTVWTLVDSEPDK